MQNGTHIGGSLANLPQRFKDLNCTTAQIFLHNPRAYKRRGVIPERDIEGVTFLTEGGNPIVAHCTHPCKFSYR